MDNSKTKNDIRSRWDEWYIDEKNNKLDSNYSPWLRKYHKFMNSMKSPYAVDLGCGRGFNTRYLIESGFKVLSVDYSLGALTSTRSTTPNSFLLQFDFRDYFPMTGDVISLVVADLSLHYFSAAQTKKIVQELHRILIYQGWLIARVNSTNDHGFLSVKNDLSYKLEEDYFIYQGIPRRYFREATIRQYFSSKWKIDRLEEKKLTRYEKPKVLWEFCIQKI
jgi:SAM-dependent methyltransferase